MRQRFTTHTSKSAVAGVFVGFLIVIPSGWIFIKIAASEIDGGAGIVVPGIILLFFFCVLVFALVKQFAVYVVDRNLILKKPPFSKRVITRDEIQYVEVLSAEQTTQILQKSVGVSKQAAEDQDISGVIGALKNDIPLYRYFTIVPKPFSSSDASERIQPSDIKISDRAVILVLKDQGLLYLSPKDPERFVRAVKNM